MVCWTSPTSPDAITTVELALAEAERLARARMVDTAPRDDEGNVLSLITIVTDDGGPFWSFGSRRSSPPIPSCDVRTGVKSLGCSGMCS